MNLSTTLGRFRFIGILEALSYLLLLGIAMPLKYLADMPLAVKYTGWAHGVLFVMYVGLLIVAAFQYRWSLLRVSLGFVASLVPFGPFLFDKMLHRDEQKKKPEPMMVVR